MSNLSLFDVKITESAKEKIQALIKNEKKISEKTLRLRLSITGGGCSGFQYNFILESHINEDDKIFGLAPAQVIIDEVSLGLLAGGEIDFVEDLMGASFVIRNPNASSSCGCGNSFSIG